MSLSPSHFIQVGKIGRPKGTKGLLRLHCYLNDDRDKLKVLEKKPEGLNLLNIYSEISKINLEKVLNEMSGKNYSHVKEKLTDLLINEICPVGKEIKKLMGDKTHLLQILKKGSEKARIKAEENLNNIREKVGLL